MPMLAVIDLGTNTFHLLIVALTKDGSFLEIFRDQRFIKLAEDGIERIGPAPYQRGLNTLRDFARELQKHEVKAVRAFGTAALRTAANGPEFIQEVRQQTGIEIKLIPGQEEARLIHRGVMQALPRDNKNKLIMDIGGGSVEFIHANDEQVFWSQSFPVGVAVLFNRFHHQDPISKEEIKEVHQFLHSILQPLLNQIKNQPIDALIGASGTFDVLENMLSREKSGPHHTVISTDRFYPVYEEILKSTQSERHQHPDIPETRADMIVVAMILIDFVLQQRQIPEIIVSAFAMKEGMISEMAKQLDSHSNF